MANLVGSGFAQIVEGNVASWNSRPQIRRTVKLLQISEIVLVGGF